MKRSLEELDGTAWHRRTCFLSLVESIAPLLSPCSSWSWRDFRREDEREKKEEPDRAEEEESDDEEEQDGEMCRCAFGRIGTGLGEGLA